MATRRGLLARWTDRISQPLRLLTRAQSQTEPEQVAKVEVTEPSPGQLSVKPRGLVYRGQFQPSALANWMSTIRREYTVDELRQAAKLPVVSMIIGTIVRDVHSYDLRVEAPEDGAEARAEDVSTLSSVLAKPYARGLDTFRTCVDMICRDLMVIGHSDVELLRADLGQTGKALRAYRALPDGERDVAGLLRKLDDAIQERGPIRGWEVMDPAYIRVNMDKHGTLRAPAYYDVSSTIGAMASQVGQAAYKPGMISWDQWDFCRLLWQSTSERDRRAEGRGAVEDGYPLIDILWTVLVRLADEVDQPTRDRILSFQRSGPVPLTSQQIDGLVEGVRHDLEVGNLPVLGGVEIDVKDVGPTVDLEHLTIVDQISLMLWVLFGAGTIQMGKVDTSSRATAEVQVAQARKQAVGNLKMILKDDLFVARFVADPFSEFGGLLPYWEDTGIFLSVEDRMEFYEVLMRYGLPVGSVLIKEFPELAALLERLGVDPMELLPPSALSAGLAAGSESAEPPGGEETEEAVEVASRLLRELRRA